MSVSKKYGIKKGPKTLMETLGARTKELRKLAGYSRERFATKSGVSASSIKKFENTGIISLESFFKICQALERLDEFENLLILRNSDKKHLFDI